MKYNAGNMSSFSMNGRNLKCVSHNDMIQCMCLSRDGEYLITGGNKGIVEVWRTYDLNLLYAFPYCDSAVRAVALTMCQKYVLAGIASGAIMVFHIDFNKWHHEFQELSLIHI